MSGDSAIFYKLTAFAKVDNLINFHPSAKHFQGEFNAYNCECLMLCYIC